MNLAGVQSKHDQNDLNKKIKSLENDKANKDTAIKRIVLEFDQQSEDLKKFEEELEKVKKDNKSKEKQIIDLSTKSQKQVQTSQVNDQLEKELEKERSMRQDYDLIFKKMQVDIESKRPKIENLLMKSKPDKSFKRSAT